MTTSTTILAIDHSKYKSVACLCDPAIAGKYGLQDMLAGLGRARAALAGAR